MPLLGINATAQGLVVHGSPQSVRVTLAKAAQGHGPVVIMVHGYKYAPLSSAHCPHETLFAQDRWPMQLGRGSEQTLFIAFGWPARGALGQAYDAALSCARQLAQVVAALRMRGPVSVIAHSLGATLALAALHDLARTDIQRIVLLSGAAHVDLAGSALASPAGSQCDVFHVTSASNHVFDLLFERLIAGAGAIGRGLPHANASTLQIDCPKTQTALAQLGYPIGPAERAICHWSSYTRSGVMALNAALLSGVIGHRDLRVR